MSSSSPARSPLAPLVNRRFAHPDAPPPALAFDCEIPSSSPTSVLLTPTKPSSSSHPLLAGSSPSHLSRGHGSSGRKRCRLAFVDEEPAAAFHDSDDDDDDHAASPMDIDLDNERSPARDIREALVRAARAAAALPPPPSPLSAIGCAPPQPSRPNRGNLGRELSFMGLLDGRSRSCPGSRMRRNERTLGTSGLASQISTVDYYLSNFVSSHSDDVFRMPSYFGRDFAPPIVCAFSNGAKRGTSSMIAVGSEEGGLEFIDASQTAQWDREHQRVSFRAHENFIFDLNWSPDDSRIVTASGAQVSGVFDVETQQLVASLVGHTSSVKTALFDTSNPAVLASASRDGHIHVYDLRDRSTGSGFEKSKRRGGRSVGGEGAKGRDHEPVNVIRHAHGEKGLKRKPSPAARTATRSPTSLVYLPQREHMLASAGSGDGVIKLWDLRTHGSYSNKAAFPALAVSESPDNTTFASSSSSPFISSSSPFPTQPKRRPHGIAALALSPTGDVLYALTTDARIHTHSPLDISQSQQSLPPSSIFAKQPVSTPTYGHSDLRTSFYSRLAVSPCGRYLASGSARGGGVHLWEIGGPLLGVRPQDTRERQGIVLRTASEETAGVEAVEQEIGCVDWGMEGLVTCSDDLSVRMWKSRPEKAAWLREDREAARWNLAGRALDKAPAA